MLQKNALPVLLITRDSGEIQFNRRQGLLFGSSRLWPQEDGCAKWVFFKIVLLLQQQGFIMLQFVQVLRQKWPIERDPFLAMLALLFSPLVQNQVPFPFGSSMDRAIGVSNTLDPLPYSKPLCNIWFLALVFKPF